jgi:hypothetical protein
MDHIPAIKKKSRREVLRSLSCKVLVNLSVTRPYKQILTGFDLSITDVTE